MLFRVENLGPLREAEVDLSKDMIVLTGPNNTGKTYLAWSIYGLFRFRPTGGSALLDQWAEDLLTWPAHEIDLGEALTTRWQDILSIIARAFLTELHRCFAAKSDYFTGATVSLRADNPDAFVERMLKHGRGFFDAGLKIHLDRFRGSTRLKLGFSRGMGSGNDPTEIVSNLPSEDRMRIKAYVRETLLISFSHAIFPSCILFPAERIAVNIFAKELALKRTALVDELVDADIEGNHDVSLDLVRRQARRYPWPIRDSLLVANDLAQLSNEKTSFADLADELERAVLGGKVGISDYGEMFFAPDGAPERRLEVHLTASVVKSLSSLVFYFRHMARQNDFLIIDEPELNLHPDNQRRIARTLAKAVRRGFKILMSTHSDCILRELNHMILLSKLSPEDTRELGYDPDCSLGPERVGVYLFNHHEARQLPIEETGFAVQTIDDEMSSLNSDAQRLYARLFG